VTGPTRSLNFFSRFIPSRTPSAYGCQARACLRQLLLEETTNEESIAAADLVHLLRFVRTFSARAFISSTGVTLFAQGGISALTRPGGKDFGCDPMVPKISHLLTRIRFYNQALRLGNDRTGGASNHYNSSENHPKRVFNGEVRALGSVNSPGSCCR
jgi:hypothetical protein